MVAAVAVVVMETAAMLIVMTVTIIQCACGVFAENLTITGK